MLRELLFARVAEPPGDALALSGFSELMLMLLRLRNDDGVIMYLEFGAKKFLVHY